MSLACAGVDCAIAVNILRGIRYTGFCGQLGNLFARCVGIDPDMAGVADTIPFIFVRLFSVMFLYK